MGHLPQVLSVLLVHALVEAGVRTGWQAPWLVLPLAAVPWLLGTSCRAVYARGGFRAGEALHFALRHCAPILHGLALALGGWDRWLGSLAGADLSLLDWPTPWHVLLLLPWFVYELSVVETRTRLYIAVREQRAWRSHQLRSLAATLAPLLFYLLLALLVGLSEPLRVQVEEVGLYEALFLGALLALLALCLPRLVSLAWRTAPLAHDERRARIEALLARGGLAGTRVREWKTGYQTTNAAVVGLTASSRLVLLSDALLAQMDDDEIEAVAAHEMAHVRLRHVPLFLALALGSILALDLAARRWAPEDEWLAGAIMLGGLAAWFTAFTWLSRRAELQADLWAIDLVGARGPMTSALEKVGGRLRDVAGWRHFSVAERVAFLERCSSEPALRRKLERTLRLVAAGSLLLFLVAAGLQVRRLVQAAPAQHAWAALRLGRWSEAQARYSHALPDPELERYVRRAATLPPGATEAVELARRAQDALATGDDGAAAEWLGLAALRDPLEWRSTLQAFEEGRDAGVQGLRARLDALDGR